ncbi:MAG: sulfatase, partial [Acidobacteriota bacterium]
VGATETDAYEPPAPLPAFDFDRARSLAPQDLGPAPGAVGPQPTRAGAVRALDLPLGRRVGWRLRLGAQPSVRFQPLATGRLCAFRYRVGVVADDAQADAPERQIWETTVYADHPEAPAVVQHDLGRWADRSVLLLIETLPIRPAGLCQIRDDGVPDARWAGLTVQHRPSPSAAAPPPFNPDDNRPNLLLITYDALRADALGAYGAVPSASPTFDRLADDADLWLTAFAPFNVTNPSLASLHTGRYGKNHGVYALNAPLPTHHVTLAMRLREAGYATGAILGAQHLARSNAGLHPGFVATGPDGVETGTYAVARNRFSAELLTDLAIGWMQGQRTPFFLWIHYFDPHTPHQAPRPYAHGLHALPSGLGPVRGWRSHRAPGKLRFRNLQLGAHEMMYVDEIAQLDRQLDRLLAFLASRGPRAGVVAGDDARGANLLDRTVLAITADHGENLPGDPQPFRHVGLRDATLHVPLLVRWPGGQPDGGRRHPGLVQTFDLYPTLLRAAGIAPLRDADGELRHDGIDLTPDPDTGASARRRAVFAEHQGAVGAWVRTEDHAYAAIGAGHALAEPGETFTVLQPDAAGTAIDDAGTARQRLVDLLARFLADVRPDAGERAAETPIDDETREQLRALGYVDP